MQLPRAFTQYRQFVLWIAKPSSTRPGKTDKITVDPHTGWAMDAHNPANWLSADEALGHLAAGRGHGVGFVFTAQDPFFFLDLDDAWTPQGWSPVAQTMCQAFAGCFVEVSQSGTGLHIFGSISHPTEHGCRNKPYDLELYTSGRFVALTGTHATGDAATPVQPQFDWLVANYFPVTAPGEAVDWTEEPDPGWSGPADDDELLAMMLDSRPSAAAVFGGRGLLGLWHGDITGYANDHSGADAALCQHLAFWTGRDCERMDRLFRRSGLMRDKWDEMRGATTYGVRTILGAVGLSTKVLQSGSRPDPVPVEPPPDDSACWRAGAQLMTIPNQVELFKGCVYVRSQHAAFVPDGALLKPDQFRVAFGGWEFSMGFDGSKNSKNAWEAFTESKGYNFPKVHDLCFRPELASGQIIEESGLSLVNVYVPTQTPQTPGDPSRVLQHLAKLLPHPQDQQILLAYMAALVQNPGKKFQWAPLLQGVEGNGKSLFTRCLAFAVGDRYTHMPNAEDIGNKFNPWVERKLFAGIEEIHVANRQEIIEPLKRLITEARLEIQGKGANQVMGDNRCNFFMCSNHRDAVRKTANDRRNCVFFTAQQAAEDITRDGMGGSYFPDLYDWLNNGGYAIFNYFLHHYPVPDHLNPATSCQRAPVTSTTQEAMQASMGSIEQEVQEAIEAGVPGFCGGWISSLAFDRLLDDRRLSGKIPRTRRRELLRSLGYDWHPGLHDGRVNNVITEPGGLAGKPRLYIHLTHPHRTVAVGSEITRLYLEAQAGATSMAAAVFGG